MCICFAQCGSTQSVWFSVSALFRVEVYSQSVWFHVSALFGVEVHNQSVWFHEPALWKHFGFTFSHL